MSEVRVHDLVAGYGSTPVVRQACCRADSGSLLAIVGASGSGKTTLLRAIAGFIPAQSGTIHFGDRLVTGPGVAVPPEKRHVGVVTQDGSLFPHLTVARNIAFGLPRRTMPDGTPVAARVDELLAVVGLTGLGERYPHELSGGQQQRVALARALAPRPAVVLLDEPFSALDAGLRSELGQEVRALLSEVKATSILVTHDQDEALSLADSVALLIDGSIAQQGTPQEVYDRPTSLEVASFLGEVNVLPTLAPEVEGHVTTALGHLPFHGTPAPGMSITLRPEQIVLTSTPEGQQGDGRVVALTYFGHDSMVDVHVDDGPIVRARVLGNAGLAVGDEVTIGVRGEAHAG